jgi:hypothetical protein
MNTKLICKKLGEIEKISRYQQERINKKMGKNKKMEKQVLELAVQLMMGYGVEIMEEMSK